MKTESLSSPAVLRRLVKCMCAPVHRVCPLEEACNNVGDHPTRADACVRWVSHLCYSSVHRKVL